MVTIITVIKGDGIGSSIVDAAFKYSTTDAITHNKIVQKGPLTTTDFTHAFYPGPRMNPCA